MARPTYAGCVAVQSTEEGLNNQAAFISLAPNCHPHRTFSSIITPSGIMEPVGLAVGIAGLAGLFSSCLEAVDMIHTYLSFGADSHVLDTRLKAAKVRLETWGRRVGLEKAALSEKHHPALEEDDISATVQGILKIVKTLSDATDASSSRSNQTAIPSDGSSPAPLLTRVRGLRRQKAQLGSPWQNRADGSGRAY